MITKKDLKIAKLTAPKIKQYVIDVLLSKYEDFNNIEDYIREIFEYGCVSGVVPTLIYYQDTISFYEKHKHAINEYLYDIMEEIEEYDLGRIFVRWVESDPLALDIPNKNELAWFGFERALQDLCMELNISI